MTYPISRTIVGPSNFPQLLQALRSSVGPLVLDLETSGLDPYEPGAKIAGVAIYDPNAKAAWYCSFNHAMSRNLPMEALRELVVSISHREHTYHNAKFDIIWQKWILKELFGKDVSEQVRWPDHDTMFMVKVLHFLRDAGLKEISATYGIQQQHLDELVNFKAGQTICDLPVGAVLNYATDDVILTWEVQQRELPTLLPLPQYQIYRLEMAAIPITVEMGMNGFPADKKRLEELYKVYTKLREECQEKAWTYFKDFMGCNGSCPHSCPVNKKKCEFAIHSSKPLGTMLFEYMKLPTDGIKQTKTGWSTEADGLMTLRAKTGLEVLDHILGYKEAIKGQGMVETYIENIREDGRIHCDLIQVWVITGRLAAQKPNMQQVPKNRRGQKSQVTGFRKAFVAPKGYYILELDFSQVEMRIFAQLANARALIDAFNRGEDIHRRTGSMTYGVSLDLVTEDQRTEAKTTGFGLIYGQTEHGLAIKLKISVTRATRIRDAFFAAIPEFPRFISSTVRYARQNGGVYTQFGRWVPLPDIKHPNRYTREKAERLAVNARVQGTAADVMKMALVRARHAIREAGMQDLIQPVLTVHDSLELLVDQDVAPEDAVALLRPAMEMDFGDLRLTVDADWGYNWGELKEVGAEEKEHTNGQGDEDIRANLTIDVIKADDAGFSEEIADLLQGMKDPLGLTVMLVAPGKRSMLPFRVDRSVEAFLSRFDPQESFHEVRR